MFIISEGLAKKGDFKMILLYYFCKFNVLTQIITQRNIAQNVNKYSFTISAKEEQQVIFF